MLKIDGPNGAQCGVLDGETALRIDRLSYCASRGDDAVPLVADLSLSVAPGEVVAIVGPNGAGKTTLVRLLAGLATPTSGQIRIGGRPLSDLSFAERARQIAYVGQSEEPDGRLSVEQYVALGGLPFRRERTLAAQKDHVADALAAVGLACFAKRRMEELSGGERQKAKIARAICQQPSLFLLDEPTNHLDPYARGEVLGLIASMGSCAIAALHDLTLVDAFADKVAVISNGRLVAFGPPRQVLTADCIMDVFRVEMHRFDHPSQARMVPALDIAVQRTGR